MSALTLSEHVTRLRERLALLIAPSLYVPEREAREEAFKVLADYAYHGAAWTSPTALVCAAITKARREGAR